MDRALHTDCYPALSYPEVYLLDGGYKNFYSQFTPLCTHQSYRPMLHKDFKEELRFYRNMTKTRKVVGRKG